ncbi:MAG: proton-conducting transporter membrane subunit [Sphaerochaeta sp.]
MSIDTLFLAPIYLPLLAASLILAAKAFAGETVRKAFELLGFLIGLVLPAFALFALRGAVWDHQSVETVIGAWETSLGVHYHFDGLSYLLIALHLVVSIPVWLYSRHAGPTQNTFSVVFFVQCAAVAATSLTADLFNLFVCLEVMGITSYVLVASSEKDSSALASFSYLIFSATAMVFFLLGAFGLYRITGSLSYEAIAVAKNNLGGNDLVVAQLSLVLIVISTLLRSAVFPLHGWLVGAHSKAPHAVSALLSGVLIKIPLFALVRLLLLVVGSQRIGFTMAWAGGISSVVGILLALFEHQAKRLLAYSSISQIGYVVCAYGLAVKAGIETEKGALLLGIALLYGFCHALSKSLLFLTVGTTTDVLGTKDLNKARGAIAALRQRGERIPLTFICFIIATLSMTALPPTIGFMGKNTMLHLAKNHASVHLLSITSALTIVAYSKLALMFLPSKKALAVDESCVVSKTMKLSYALLALMILAGGFFYERIQRFLVHILTPLSEAKGGYIAYYAYEDLGKTLVTVGLAFLCIVLTRTAWVRKLIRPLSSKEVGFADLFFGYALAIGFMAANLLW